MLSVAALVLRRHPALAERLLSALRAAPLHLLVDLLGAEETRDAAARRLARGRPVEPRRAAAVHVLLVEAQRRLPRYTCQWAFEGQEGKVSRRFLSFGSTDEYLGFFRWWADAQPRRPTCLMECTSAEHPRKWVMDMDSPLADEARLHARVHAFAADACRRLHAANFAPRVPGFALLTRHRSNKRSWHVVLLVLAPYPQWRAAMLAIDEGLRGAHPEAAAIYDPAVLRNSRGQYMQTLHSCKVPASPGAEGFRFHSLHLPPFDSPEAAPTPQVQELLASALLPDPHSFASLPFHALQKEEAKTKKRSRRAALGSSGEWEGLPAFAREMLEGEGTALHRVESVRQPPPHVAELLHAGLGEVTWQAEVLRPRLCPRALAHRGAAHRHSSNHLLAMAVRESMPRERTAHRAFALCFSDKCCKLGVQRWVELLPSMLLPQLSVVPVLSPEKPVLAEVLEVAKWEQAVPAHARARLPASPELGAPSEELPPLAQRLLRAGRAELTWCSAVAHARLCPRHQPGDVLLCALREAMQHGRHAHRAFARCLACPPSTGWEELRP